jgi:hypothetical protein
MAVWLQLQRAKRSAAEQPRILSSVVGADGLEPPTYAL